MVNSGSRRVDEMDQGQHVGLLDLVDDALVIGMAQVPAVAVVNGRSRRIFLSHCAIPRSERSSHVASSSMTWHFSESPGLSSICCRNLRALPCTSSASTSAFLQASAQKRHRPHRCAPSRRAPGCSRCPRGPGSSHKSRTGSSPKSIGQVALRSELQFTFVGIITRLRLIVVPCVVLGIARSKVGLVIVLDVVLGIIVRVVGLISMGIFRLLQCCRLAGLKSLQH